MATNPFGEKALTKLPPTREEELKQRYENNPFALPEGKNRLCRYEYNGTDVTDLQNGNKMNDDEVLAQLNKLNDFIFSLWLEYNSALAELAILKPSCKTPEGAMVLRHRGVKEKYLKVIE